MESFDEIKAQIAEQSGLCIEDIQIKIEDKQVELSGLISLEGAAHLVARELGIDLLKRVDRRLEIRNVVSGMRSVEVIGRIMRIFESRDFEKNGKTGKVASIVLWDPTGTIRVSLWNNETALVKNLKDNQVVKIKGYAKEDNRGSPELRVGNKGSIEILDDRFPEIAVAATKRVRIAELREGTYAEIKGMFAQIFESNLFYEICPKCGIRLKQSNEKFFCNEHSYVEPDYGMVLSGIIDDGSESVRVVFFRDVAEKVLGMKTQEALDFARKKLDKIAPIVDAEQRILGQDFILTGRVKKNALFERLEFIADSITSLNVAEETERLVKEINAIEINKPPVAR
ncbi:MAG: OB-fold nucleic acid binding domain-containing protein [Candidatus Aenigmatarchaeota archaeon]